MGLKGRRSIELGEGTFDGKKRNMKSKTAIFITAKNALQSSHYGISFIKSGFL